MILKKSIVLFVVLSLTSFVGAQSPPGQIGVSPALVEVEIGTRPVDESLKIHNFKKKAVRVKVEINNWTLDEQNEVQLIPPDSQSLDQWMIINPLEFTVSPGKSQTVRFSIRPPSKPTPGEHRAMIFFVEQPSEGVKKTSSMEMLFRFGVGVYGYAEPVEHNAVLYGIKRDAGASVLSVEIENKGNAHTRLKGEYAIWEADSFSGFAAMRAWLDRTDKDKTPPEGFISSGVLNHTPILPGHRRKILTGLPPLYTLGNCMIAVEGKIDEQKVQELIPCTP